MVAEIMITTHGAQETARLGELLGSLVEAGDVILLQGNLGAGKTTFSQGVARGLQVVEPLTSPTFTLVNEYEGKVPLAHMDLYRLSQSEETSSESAPESASSSVAEVGWEDYLESDYVVLIEWPEAILADVADGLLIRIERVPLPRLDDRVFHCQVMGSGTASDRHRQLLDEWVKRWLF